MKSAAATHCRKKFLRYFKRGFRDETYVDWERGYKQRAHQQWLEVLDRPQFKALLNAKKFSEIAGHAVRIESRTNLLFSFEKMALRDAVKSPSGAKLFANGLYDFLHGRGNEKNNLLAGAMWSPRSRDGKRACSPGRSSRFGVSSRNLSDTFS